MRKSKRTPSGSLFLATVLSMALATLPACQKSKDDKADGEGQGAAAPGKADPNRKPAELSAPGDVAAPPADAQKTEKGVFYKVLRPGTGSDKPGPTDTVEVNYSGWQTDGKMFDSSFKRGKSTSFPLNRVIPGWTDGLQQMTEGSWFRFWIPEKLAYRGRDPKGMLVFDVELVAIKRGPKAPPDVAAAPADATRTDSGLAYKLLESKNKDNTGKKPRAWDKVTVQYTGWTTDGKQFDSSYKSGKPASFALYNVIDGWTEGLQLMNAGDKYRFWIPKELAYNDEPGKPKGMLVFDVELISVAEQKQPPATPKDLTPVPANAKKTDSGLAYRVIKPGKGASPKPEQMVEVHYTGWTKEGKLLDSTVVRDKAAKFPLGRARLAGWKEGIALMKPGATYRFWIPDELALKGRGPKGPLVFDIELISVKDGPSVPPGRVKMPKGAKMKMPKGAKIGEKPGGKSTAVPIKKVPTPAKHKGKGKGLSKDKQAPATPGK